jgi:DNA-binding CsgD family transcriptional regulator
VVEKVAPRAGALCYGGKPRGAFTVTGMARAASDLGSGVVGREQELNVLHAFFGADRPQRQLALVLAGGAGIGKTTLWETGLEIARHQHLRVLFARPSNAEARLAFAALIDLFDGVATDELSVLPLPQRQALEVALLRAAPTGPAPGTHAIAVGFLNALRALAGRDSLLVAVDDIESLDAPSANVLVFAARRLEGSGVRFLVARRPGPPSALEQALEHGGVEHRNIGPLSIAALRRLLLQRLGLSVSRPLMRRIFDATLGNPLFALEVGRTLVERGVPAIGEDLPVPDAVEDLLGTRVATLPRDQGRLLLAVALNPDLRTGQLAELAGQNSLDDAIESGVLVVEGDHVRASHPLLAGAATRHAPEEEQRALHRDLAPLVSGGQLRVRHLALASARPDAGLAATVASAAADAARRGAAHAAVELAEHALRLTPGGDPARADRVLALARYLEVAGDLERLTELLTAVLDEIPKGPARVQAYLLLSSGAVEGNDDVRRYLERALDETGDDAALRISVLAELATNDALALVERIREAEAWAADVLPVAQHAGPEVERLVLYVLSWTRALRGRPIDEVCERFRASSDAAFYIATSPERVAGQRLAWRGDVGGARAALTRLLSTADERGESSSYALQRLHLCELELRVGAWDEVSRLLDEWAEPGEGALLDWPMYERCRALVAAGRGLPDEAQRWAATAIASAEATGIRWDALEAMRARGMAFVLAGEPGDAAEELRAVWEHTEREGVDDPGVFPVAPDLVEALVALGEPDEASAVGSRLAALAEAQEHPWGRATARRCIALVQLAQAQDDSAVATIEQAAEEYAGLGLRFDRARTLLSLGRVQRRFRHWGAARDALDRAAAAFDELGSAGWAGQARSELARAGARRPAQRGELTPAERRVAELAAEGLANKEIARALVVTVSTVEFHLSNVYAKLGVRSRAALAARLAPQHRGDPKS